MATRESPPLARRCVCLGLVFGTASGWWILETHRSPALALHYHVPLLTLLGVQLSWCVLAPPEGRGYRDWVTLVVAVLLVWARLTLDWPTSGHGILGAYLAMVSPWRWMKVLGLCVLPQAVITKAIIGAPVMDVAWGALVGVLLGLLARPRDP